MAARIIEISDYGTPESWKRQDKVFQEQSATTGRAVHAKTLSFLDKLERDGVISYQHLQAAEKFHRHFCGAKMERYATINLFRVTGSIGETDSYIHDLTESRKALKMLGRGLVGSIIWHVCGTERSLAEWVRDRTAAGFKVNEHNAKGMLIAGLEVLAEHFGV